MNKPKQKRRSQHAKDQVELKLEVSHSTTNLEEDGTEVLHNEEATSNKPVPEGTEIPLRRTNSTHYHQDNTSLKHEKYTVGIRIANWFGIQIMRICSFFQWFAIQMPGTMVVWYLDQNLNIGLLFRCLVLGI